MKEAPTVSQEARTPTPRPWQIYRYAHGSGRIHKDERTLIADVHGPEANREFVFEAVNAYDRLRAIEAAALTVKADHDASGHREPCQLCEALR